MPPASLPIPESLLDAVREASALPVSPAFGELARGAAAGFGDAVEAVLLYGSCLRANDPAAGVVDLFVIVADYRCLTGRAARAMNTLLPPNVYYLKQADDGGVTLRCKYAVISLQDFEAGTRDWLQPCLWARFCQPVRLQFARNAEVRDRVCRALATAVVRFLRETIPAMETETFTTADIWRCGLARSYGTELRPESARRPEAVFSGDADHFRRVTAAAQAAIADCAVCVNGAWQRVAAEPLRRACLRSWLLRRWQGPVLSLLRWIKAAFTFSGSVDYAAWKIERHTGVRIVVTDRLRRHPLIYGWPILWKLWRGGALR